MSKIPNSAPQRRPAKARLLVSTLAIASPALLADVSQFNCSQINPNIPIDPNPKWDDGTSGFGTADHYLTIQTGDVDGDGQAELLGRGPAGLAVNHFDKSQGLWIPGPNTLTDLSNANNWNQPEYYLTIQTADIDGDSKHTAELIGRSKDGVTAYFYNPGSNTWTPYASDLFSDANGWNNEYYYATIQLADIDGDGRAELLARGSTGMLAYQWDNGQNKWTPLGGVGPFPDSDGATDWTQTKYYTTIQLADIDGDGAAELLGRGVAGIATYRWNKGNQSWDPLSTSGPFSDASGWYNPENYSTIQLADIDGDRHAELVARSDGGMNTYAWQNNQWVQLGGIGPFSDALSWGSPEFYSTIQLADVDGDGKAELLGRGSAGMNAYTWNASNTTWDPLGGLTTPANNPPWSDASGWGVASSYATIQAADVDGDHKAELIGKSSDGIVTMRYSGKNGVFASTLVSGFPAFTAGQQAAYQAASLAISQELVGVTDDVRGQYTNTLNQHGDWRAARDKALALANAPPPAGISQEDWAAVIQQLSTELGYVRLATIWFDNLSALNNQTAIFENAGGGTVGFVAGFINLPTNNSTNVILNWFSLAFRWVNGVAGLAGPLGGGPVAGIIGSVANLSSTAFSTAIAASGQPPSLAVQVQDLEAKLIDTQTMLQSANVCLKKAYLSSYELLKPLVEPISKLTVAWDDTLNVSMAVAGRRGYELYVWQTLTPVKWGLGATFQVDAPAINCIAPNNPPSNYPLVPNTNTLWDYFLPNGGGKNIYIVPDGQCGGVPSTKALERLFLPPNPDGITGSLGVPLADLHCGLNGWAIRDPNDTHSSPVKLCPSQSPSVSSPKAQKQLNRQQVQQMRARNAFATRQINSLMRDVRRTVPGRGKAKRTLRTTLLQPLQGALRYVKQMKRGQEATYGDFASQQLHLFNMRLRAHGTEIVAPRAASHTAKAHLIRAKLKEVDLPLILTATAAGKR